MSRAARPWMRPWIAFVGALAFTAGYPLLYETTWWGWGLVYLACTAWGVIVGRWG